MAYYRLYQLNGSHIVSALPIEADSDQEAIRIAGRGLRSKARELWCLDRKVHVFEAEPDRPEIHRATE